MVDWLTAAVLGHCSRAVIDRLGVVFIADLLALTESNLKQIGMMKAAEMRRFQEAVSADAGGTAAATMAVPAAAQKRKRLA